jgi:hypothetical protein
MSLDPNDASQSHKGAAEIQRFLSRQMIDQNCFRALKIQKTQAEF